MGLATRSQVQTATKENQSRIERIQNKIKRLLEMKISAGESPSVTIPPVIELSGLFSCSEMDILKALNGLRTVGYNCQTRGLDENILLEDKSLLSFFKPGKKKSHPLNV